MSCEHWNTMKEFFSFTIIHSSSLCMWANIRFLCIQLALSFTWQFCLKLIMSLACIGSFFSSHVYLFFHNKTSLCFGVSVSSFFFCSFCSFQCRNNNKKWRERNRNTQRRDGEKYFVVLYDDRQIDRLARKKKLNLETCLIVCKLNVTTITHT